MTEQQSLDILGIQDVQLRQDGADAKITWIDEQQRQTVMVIPSEALKKLMRGLIEIVTALHSAAAVPLAEMVDPRDYKPMPDVHIVERLNFLFGPAGQQVQLRVLTKMHNEVLIQFPPAQVQMLLDALEQMVRHQQSYPTRSPGQSGH